jgi:hypothetical protein
MSMLMSVPLYVNAYAHAHAGTLDLPALYQSGTEMKIINDAGICPVKSEVLILVSAAVTVFGPGSGPLC